jgi:hypothetical protein
MGKWFLTGDTPHDESDFDAVMPSNGYCLNDQEVPVGQSFFCIQAQLQYNFEPFYNLCLGYAACGFCPGGIEIQNLSG